MLTKLQLLKWYMHLKIDEHIDYSFNMFLHLYDYGIHTFKVGGIRYIQLKIYLHKPNVPFKTSLL